MGEIFGTLAPRGTCASPILFFLREAGKPNEPVVERRSPHPSCAASGGRDADETAVMKTRKLRIVAAVVTSFSALIVLVMALLIKQVITFQMALLMLVALFGLYFGFGVLIAIYRFVSRLE